MTSAPSRRRDPAPLLLCSNSPWLPAIRRDHALARTASEQGHQVLVAERPLDVRALRSGQARSEWVAGLLRPGRTQVLAPRLELQPRSTLAPGHRGGATERLDTFSLRRALTAARRGKVSATVVATVPWHWPAVAGVPAARRVFDAADDWRRLNPDRAERFEELYRRIGREADRVVVVSPVLQELFPETEVEVVPNAVDDTLLDAPPSPANDERRLAYVGTLSERFDVELVREMLGRLEGWRLDLYGQCQYAGRGEDPSPELQSLLEDLGGRVSWHGVISRAGLAEVLDAASVLVVPNRPEHSAGQDSMKAYDYAARGRPIVSTRWPSGLTDVGPPGVYAASDAEEFASQVLAAADEPRERGEQRRQWARRQTWGARWPSWSRALFGNADVAA